MEKLKENVSLVNNLLGIVSTFIGIMVAVGGLFYSFYKEYQIELLLFVIFIETIFIVYLFFKLSKKNDLLNLNIDKNFDILNNNLFEIFIKERLTTFKSKISQLNKGYLRLIGKEVKDIQISFIDYVLRSENKEILTLDLTVNPHLWLSRKEYIEKNEKFIQQGGIIKRVLIIDNEKLKDKDFLINLKKLGNIFLNNGVVLKIIFIQKLNEDEAEDFIIYDKFSVLVEDKQASVDYKIASSTLFFDESNYDKYKKLFNTVYNKAEPFNKIIGDKYDV